jgi:DNA-binding transcriptional LysR family regulator
MFRSPRYGDNPLRIELSVSVQLTKVLSYARQVQQFGDMLVFAKVVEQSSFSGAARVLGLTKSAVSKQVRRLEDGLNAKLLHRTTRRLSLTEAGHVLYEHAASAALSGDAAQNVLNVLTSQPTGVLRMTASPAYATYVLAPLMPEFHRRYPDIHVALTLMDRHADLTEDGLDLAIRLTSEPPPFLAGRPLHSCDFVLCASPAFVRRVAIQQPQDLAGAQCLSFTPPGPHRAASWRLQRDGGKDEVVAVSGCISVNSSEMVRALVIQGLGVGLLPVFTVAQDIREKRLQPVLAKWRPQGTFGAMAWALWQPHRQMPQKVRVMVDYLVEKLAA